MIHLIGVPFNELKKVQNLTNKHCVYEHKNGEDEYVYGVCYLLKEVGVEPQLALRLGYLFGDVINRFENCRIYISVVEDNITYYHKKVL